MKKIVLILVLIFSSNLIVTAQAEKIKGDRNVTIKQTLIDEFETLLVDGDFSIEVVYGNEAAVEIETDNNLHDIIQFNVVEGVLSFSEVTRITSKKKLRITVSFSDALKHIKTSGDGEIRSLTTMNLGDVNLIAEDNSRVYLNINAKHFNFKSSGKSKTRLNIAADSAKVELSDNSKLEGSITSKVAHFDLYQRANATIDGTAEMAVIRLDNTAHFDGEKFNIKTADASVEFNSDLTLSVNESIVIAASGDSEMYLYGNPKITISKFEDTAKLQKKVKR